ncbi:MAG: hypothetical protein K2Y09_01080 [Nitrosomonas sp.]|uniref:DUF6932 family protein n=1 Tax=Nitrosomonas sp. TaxID=42353 RepID=UPI001DDFAD4A|nr:hypothetical protein [Nitrosomonas sp.]MBX9893761.1 hypothetical protein [Nitrosomonas sp.]
MEHSPLLPPGIHDVQEPELGNHFLKKFPTSTTRASLISGLQRYITLLKSYGVQFELWIDGSFTTDKVNPNDIDLVVFFNFEELDALPLETQLRLEGLVDRYTAKQNFGCDVFVSNKDDHDHRSYWRGWYGFDRNENPKGIARIAVGV